MFPPVLKTQLLCLRIDYLVLEEFKAALPTGGRHTRKRAKKGRRRSRVVFTRYCIFIDDIAAQAARNDVGIARIAVPAVDVQVNSLSVEGGAHHVQSVLFEFMRVPNRSSAGDEIVARQPIDLHEYVLLSACCSWQAHELTVRDIGLSLVDLPDVQ